MVKYNSDAGIWVIGFAVVVFVALRAIGGTGWVRVGGASAAI